MTDSYARWLLLLSLFTMTGCVGPGYYAQAIRGHMNLMADAKDIGTLIGDPATPRPLKAQLQQAQAIRRFATETLLLPDNASYQRYSDLKRPFATWVVIATPAFDLEPKRWCFPFVGCLSYRGYFDQNQAKQLATELRQQGYDTAVSGSRAYSTLGWFSDPLLNTQLGQSEGQLAEIIFHELAHQKLYFSGDTAFNEAFAVALSRYGAERWLRQSGHFKVLAAYRKETRRLDQLSQLLLKHRQALGKLYRQDLAHQTMMMAKQRQFTALKANYRRLRQGWGPYHGYDRWMNSDLNNAHLTMIATYQEMVPDFQRLLSRCNHQLAPYYQQLESLRSLAPEQRQHQLRKLRCKEFQHLDR